MTSQPERAVDDDLFASVVKAVVDTYYPDRVRSGTLARTRAQAALSAVTVFAGTLVGTFTATVLASQPTWTRVAGIATVALWFLSSMAYVAAVAANLPKMPNAGEVAGGTELVRAVLDRATIETAGVDRRLRRANCLVGVALAATVTTLAGGTFTNKQQFAPGVVTVTEAQADSIRGTCGGNEDNKVHGDVDLATIGNSFVVVRVPHCASHANALLQLPRATVVTIKTFEE